MINLIINCFLNNVAPESYLHVYVYVTHIHYHIACVGGAEAAHIKADVLLIGPGPWTRGSLDLLCTDMCVSS